MASLYREGPHARHISRDGVQSWSNWQGDLVRFAGCLPLIYFYPISNTPDRRCRIPAWRVGAASLQGPGKRVALC